MNPRVVNRCGLPVPTHEALLRALRQRVIEALGVNSTSELLDHAVAQATLELEVISAALHGNEAREGTVILGCAYSIDRIRDRLELARELAEGIWDPDRPEDTVLASQGSVE